MSYRLAIFAAVAALVSVQLTHAADPAVKCESGKLKESAKYSSCRLKAEAKGVQLSIAPDYSKCESKFADKWGKIESQAGPGACPSEGDLVEMEARITTDAAEVATLLAGGAVNLCGNQAIDAGEDCDFGDLNGETCTSLGLFGEGLACTPGTCLFDTSACESSRYEDTGLTVIDHSTGLEWQKTDDLGGLTDKDNTWTWSVGGTQPDGTLFTVLLAGLNAPDGPGAATQAGPTDTGCYAGHCDWRAPTVEELLPIMDCSFGDPCFDPIFGVLQPMNIWTATSDSADATKAFRVFGNFPFSVPTISKTNSEAGRAVRGGS